MTRLALALIACGTALVPVLSSVPVHAQNAESWISGDTGNDNNLCNRVLPCKTLPGALAVTSANGQIRCIDPPAQTAAVATITKSVTIDCAEAIITCGADAITINVAGSVTDTLRTVRLRNLSINGIRHCPPVSGIRIVNAAVVSIEDVVVEGFASSALSLDSRLRRSGTNPRSAWASLRPCAAAASPTNEGALSPSARAAGRARGPDTPENRPRAEG
jgi:hypothetical protein